MYPTTIFLVFAASVVAVSHPNYDSRLSFRTKTCYVNTSGIKTADDTPSFNSALIECGNGSTIIFKEGIDYNIFTPINITGLRDVEIKIQGNLHLPQNITYIQEIVKKTSGTWLTVQGTGVHITGTTDNASGWIESYGQAWWDANPSNGTGLAGRPHLLRFNVSSGTITHFKSRKPIAWGISLLGNDITIKHTFIDATTSGRFPFNTDGFDIGAQNVLIEDSVILNGDDAFALGAGSENIVVQNALIGGPSCHGASVGLGQNQAVFGTVKNVLFNNITAVNSLYGARFKSWVGGQGIAQNITWQNYKIHNVTFPIFVTQTYSSQGTTQSNRVDNSSVLMQDFKWKNWKGDINTYHPGDRSCVSDPCWYNVPGADGTQSIILECANSTSCENFEVRNIQITPQSLAAPTVLCSNLHNTSSLGFLCVNGTFVGTH